MTMAGNGTILTVEMLISFLREYPPEMEVRIAHQPLWPFSYTVSGVVSDAEVRTLSNPTWRRGEPPLLWLTEGAMAETINNSVWKAMVKKRGA